jgi:hypothetical protein
MRHRYTRPVAGRCCVPSAAAASAAPSPDPSALCQNGSLSNPAQGAGDDLKVEILHQQGGGSGWNLALPASSVKDFPGLAGKKTSAAETKLDPFDDGGAFSYDGAVLKLSLYNRRSNRLTIHDIRVVNKRVVCPPDGLLSLEGNEGGDFVNIAFSLDAAAPIAHEKNESGEVSPQPYFNANVIEVNPADQVTVEMDMSMVKFAYEFELAIDYTVGGSKHTQLVRRPHGPFRVTTSLCPSPGLRARLSQSDVVRLKAQHYGLVRLRTGEVDAAGSYIYKNLTTAEYLRSCPTW